MTNKDYIAQFVDRKNKRTYNRQSGLYICTYNNCLEYHYALGLCRKHWNLLALKRKQEKDFDTKLFAELKDDEIKSLLNELLENLTDRERDIINSRFFMNKTLQEVGDMYQLTKERVRQIENQVLLRLRKNVKSYKREII